LRAKRSDQFLDLILGAPGGAIQDVDRVGFVEDVS
jgi:hypothetical protein